MSEDIKKNAVEALNEFRSVISEVKDKQASYDEKIAALDGYDKEKAEKAYAAVEKFDEIQQKNALEAERLENEKKELQERVQNLEGVISKSSDSGLHYKESQEYKAFNELVVKGSISDVSMEHKDYLRTDFGEFGGFLVPASMSEEIVKQVEQVSPIRSMARVRSTRTKTLNIPIRTSLPTASFEGEAEAAGTSTSKYKSVTMTAHRQHIVVPITRDQLNFSDYDMTSEITADAVTAFSQDEGNKFVLGTGVKQPQGILDASAGISQIETAASGVLSLVDVIKLSGELKEGYNPVYAFNRKTLAALRSEQDGNGNFLMRIGGEGIPSDIVGYRYVIMQDLPDVASTSLSVVFGDFFRGYNILDALNMELVRDDFRGKEKAIVEFSWNRYLDGRVVLGEAFKILKTKA
jgi:HK97 family phage major capsid protein